jgi:hypothetical protein
MSSDEEFGRYEKVMEKEKSSIRTINITDMSEAFTKSKEPESSCSYITDMPEAFTESGECDDEITLVFDNSNKLYV